ncbi:protein NO VEIN domain-containing protein, partial [Nostoc sp.]|uniref:protein NO VEIN domain-containing protein n=1 Tax=Nostoc sp. TaxID=1180 RepID=UPI002FFB7E3A
IDYKETLPNYYDKETNTISYVRKWNSIKNNKLGDYLIQSLNLDPVKIKSDLLLQLLDDDIDEIKDYLLESGCDIGSIAHEEFYSQDYVEQQTEVTSNDETSRTITSNSVLVFSPDGTGENIEYWGEWGEKKAQKLYGQLEYYAEKQNDWLALGYDFICNKPKHKNVYSEVKTISSNEPIIRLKRSQWRCMCSDSKKDNYELLIVVHEGEYLREIIRISSAWATLKNILSQLSEESITDALYRSQVEVLLGFQQNSQGEANEILINWQRLFKSIKHSHINIYPQGIPNLKIGA